MSQNFCDPISRRTALRTAGGYCLALPFLESLFTSVPFGSTPKPPKRLIFIGGGYGHVWQSFYPQQSGRFSEIGMTPGMKPLERHKNDITMIANITNLGARNPHGGSWGYLSGLPAGTDFSHHKMTCDQLAAVHLGADTRFGSLVLTHIENTSGQGAGHGSGLSLSTDSNGTPISGITSGAELYQTIFAQSDDSAEAVLAKVRDQRSVLDRLRLDAGSLRTTLSAADRDKLDKYFSSVRQIEQNLERQEKWATIPKMKAPFPLPDIPIFDEDHVRFAGRGEVERIIDMMIVALQTDMTRVISYRLPVTAVVGDITTLDAHALSHYPASEDRTIQAQRRDVMIMELFARLLDRLKETKDADGSRLYDNCIVSYGSNLRTGHTTKDIPAIISGGGAPAIKHGRHVTLPKADTPIERLWLTLLQQAGVPVQSFNGTDTVLSELLS